MTAEIVRASAPPNGWPVGHLAGRTDALLWPGPDLDAADTRTPHRRRLPRGVEGHALGRNAPPAARWRSW